MQTIYEWDSKSDQENLLFLKYEYNIMIVYQGAKPQFWLRN